MAGMGIPKPSALPCAAFLGPFRLWTLSNVKYLCEKRNLPMLGVEYGVELGVWRIAAPLCRHCVQIGHVLDRVQRNATQETL